MFDNVQDSWSDMMLVVVITLDALWLFRNKIVHGEKKPEIIEVVRSIKRRYEAHKVVCEMNDSVQLITYQPPKNGVLKINFDVAVKS